MFKILVIQQSDTLRTFEYRTSQVFGCQLYLSVRTTATLDRVDVIGEIVAEDRSFARAVPSLLPQKISALFHREQLFPRVVNSHDDHPVDT